MVQPRLAILVLFYDQGGAHLSVTTSAYVLSEIALTDAGVRRSNMCARMGDTSCNSSVV